ncbi:hypothetical protein CHU32_13265 [Superficieibacter electus]|uniref:Uncharacterized protein n=1 Tax=Superficieibacter electus TaxID=2022662 RepID=A0A2P5GNY9_9ENTR|nr:hypothetical protein [Superficieibacter electus]POP44857.1 hypothetical protein CHU33_10340 [Superficieibacter electus]POP48244.1 hypothetical protein CHU32_13265 [Superficieibacter electus]
MITLPLTRLNHHSRGQFVACSWAADGRIAILETEKIPERIDGMFVPTRTEKQGWYITLYSPDLRRLELPVITDDINFHHIQLVDDDHLLLVCGRSRYQNGEGEKNAAIYTLNSTVVRRFTLGDGIQDISVTEDGAIWVSYFDEGVFGNYGWEEPMGRPGLVKYDLCGNILWQQDEFDICDCYALNVENPQSVWFYYYMDFKLVHLSGSDSVSYQIPVQGMQDFALCNPWIITDNGYNQHNKFTLWRLTGQQLKKQDSLQFAHPDEKHFAHAAWYMSSNRILACTANGIYFCQLSPSLFD